MTDLMRDHARELRRVVRVGDQSGVHIDVSTGNRERIDRRIFDDVELPRELIERLRRLLDDSLSHVAHVRVER
jgi:hypothetical protein